MGSTFVNLQVHARGRDSKTITGEVATCLAGVLQSDGYLPAAGDEACDRTILVAAGPRWVGVYDELCDEQRLDVVERLASELSQRVSLPYRCARRSLGLGRARGQRARVSCCAMLVGRS